MAQDPDGSLRQHMTDLMADGLSTLTEPVPVTTEDFSNLVAQCGSLPKDLVIGKMECTYYLVHRRWCDLPELDLPAEPDWWCRLWRI